MIEDRFGYWTLPKGKKEPGETDEQTALREIEEETGILGRIVCPLHTVHYQYLHPEHGQVKKTVVYYLIQADEGMEKPQLEEIKRVVWMPVEEAWQKQLTAGYENNHEVLRLALEQLKRIQKGNKKMNAKELAAMIDHTLLKPEATAEQIKKLCDEAKQYGFVSVCVNPYWVKEASKQLAGTPVKVCTVIGFPLGATTSETKVFETKDAINNGASEIDMVMNIGALKSGNLQTVQKDIEAVVQAAQGAIVKVILEAWLLTEQEIAEASKLAKAAGAHFVKTSTGFGKGGATVEAVRLMRETVGPEMGVKASGGVRDFETAQKMIEAGANRIGASSSVAIVTGGQGTDAY
jgi:deoxyribose-phosphate aldolase